MLFDLPDDDTLYAALLARDPTYDGRVYVTVATTGIFCRLTCPARKPKRINCDFHADVASCINAGFRPCKRCHPLKPQAEADSAITTLVTALENAPSVRWTEDRIAAMGFEPSTIRRSFKRHFGMTFLEMARQRRLAHGFTTMHTGKIIDAQIESGFESPSAFRTAFTKLMGDAPNRFQSDAMLRTDYINSPLGPMIVVCDKHALHLLEFIDRKALPAELKRLRTSTKGQIGIGRFPIMNRVETQLSQYFAGQSAIFDLPLAMHGTPFTKQVWTALCDIPAGRTKTYSQIAKDIAAPHATRAVARANGANQIALIIPCHRVIGADGNLTGYGGGLWRKQRLIALEQHYAKGSKNDENR